ncbi:hypothetical protein LTR37_009062 [Vermiconidia calcicola]|uniref:Uncharacterized protein n=1 Tax=Vermiconidia calcicola TaxID=1690605 RepID=A0ACC3N8Z4_9PEZI|nr:hypothetical protein LTR37_009062 [Vermiconidia calcicola]
MDDVEEAKDLIRSIRRSKRVDEDEGSDENANDLEGALRVLSVELYSKPTHFILELIQNADDNRYGSTVSPQLKIIFRTDGFLWIGCNENGFMPNNVRAICRIGHSTKKVEGSQKGYIGEKGIGFKSVFKVADVVWISSGALQFQFDKKKPLGMIAPAWCDFNAHPQLKERTMFCFQIPDAEDQRSVLRNLSDLKPELLLFLRQLRCIEIQIQKPNGTIEKSFRLKRGDDEHSGFQLILLTHEVIRPRPSTTTDKYLVCRRIASEMPCESRRPNVTESEVMIAFPVTEDFQPKLQECFTFNFLPIRKYGLPFLLQADYLLSASREEVVQGSAWNTKLISAATDLFVQSAHEFNKSGVVKYTWPRFLSSQGTATSTAFQGFLADVVDRLRAESVIESYQATMEKPIDVKHPPGIFTDGRSPARPLLSGPMGLRAYTAASYLLADLSNLRIPQLPSNQFLGMLRYLVKNKHAEFKQQTPAWHSRIAAAILSIGPQSVRNLELIPLRDRTWTSAKKTVHLPGVSDGLVLPDGINVDTVDDSATKDPSRAALFSGLGALQLNPNEVCRIILAQHASHGEKLETWTVDTPFEHAHYLFNSCIQLRRDELVKLRVASSSSTLLHVGPDLYMDVPESDFRVSEYLGASNTAVKYLHGRYLDGAPCQSKEWIDWLQSHLGVRTVPRLANKGTISQEFQCIIDSSQRHEWLLLLQRKWSSFSAEIATNNKLRSLLSNALVNCEDGQRRPLKDVYLATSSIKNATTGLDFVPFLAVDDPDDSSWVAFETIGLGVRPTLGFWMAILQSLQAETVAKPTKKSVDYVYREIDRLYYEDPTLVKNAFTTKNLVYIPTAETSNWMSLSVCRWSCPKRLSGIVALSWRYPALRDLFTSKLGVRDATVTDVVQALEKLKGQEDKSDHIRDLLLALNSLLKAYPYDSNMALNLIAASKKILPIKGGKAKLKSAVDTDWYIADRERLEDCFTDSVALLDFPRDQVATLSTLFTKLRLNDRMLSASVSEETVAAGKSSFNQNLTEQLRSKAAFVSQLVPPSLCKKVLDQLMMIEVWCCDALKLRRFVTINRGRVYGVDEEGWVVVQESSTSLVIFVPDKSGAKKRLPGKVLVEKLVSVLDVPKERAILLLMILTTDDSDEIEDNLEREGIEVNKKATEAPTDEAGPEDGEGQSSAHALPPQTSTPTLPNSSSVPPVTPSAKPQTAQGC